VKRQVLVGAAAAAAAAAWWWTDSAPYPYAQRWLLDLPLPFLTNRRLDALLAARPGERVLEIGPGTGLQALHVSGLLGEGGRLDIVDIQQPMLDHVMRRAAAAATTGPIVPARADARELPYADGSFDAAYLVTVLGEVPDPGAAVREIGRVLKPGGRLVVGEFFDRHYVPLVTLLQYANHAGLQASAWLGPPLAYFARFQPPSGNAARQRDMPAVRLDHGPGPLPAAGPSWQ
jgi:ubiquinone/menaquinone biosynthesis C-methylase UbiE